MNEEVKKKERKININLLLLQHEFNVSSLKNLSNLLCFYFKKVIKKNNLLKSLPR